MSLNKKIYLSALIVPLLLLLVQHHSPQALSFATVGGSSANQCITPAGESYTLCDVYTTYSSGGSAPFIGQVGAPEQPSPSALVSLYNGQYAPYLITCPDNPEANPTDSQYFDTMAVPYIAGDVCTAKTGTLNSQLNVSVIVGDSTFPPTAIPSVVVTNASNTSITELTYSPEVEGAVSTNHDSQSNIFGSPQINGQNLVWTWNSRYINFANAGGIAATNTIVGATTTQNGCTYTYDDTTQLVVTSFQNTYLPFDEVIPGQQNLQQIDTPILPYFTARSNTSNLDFVSGVSNLSFSYDIYGPWNYYNPSTNIDTYPINTPSLFFAEYTYQAGTPTQLIPYPRQGIGFNPGQPGNIISVAPQGTATVSTSTTGPTTGSTPGNCALTDLNCIAAYVHSQDGGSFMSTPQYAGLEIQGVQQLAQQYHFPWPYMYALLVAQECNDCVYETYPTGVSASPTSSQNCYNYWSYTDSAVSGTYMEFTGFEVNPATNLCYNPSDADLRGTYDMYNFNVDNNPIASMQNANNQLLQYWSGDSSILTTCNFDTFINQVISERYNPGANPQTYINSATSFLNGVFGPNWQAKINAASTPTSDGGCITAGPESTPSTTVSAQAVGITQINAISVSGLSTDYMFVLGSSSISQTITTSSSSSIVSEAATQLGVPYCWGGTSPAGTPPLNYDPQDPPGPYICNIPSDPDPGFPPPPNSYPPQDLAMWTATSGGFDCSGLVYWVFNELGLTGIERTANAQMLQFQNGQPLGSEGQYSTSFVSQAQSQVGDLVFFSDTGPGGSAEHVGICSQVESGVGCIQMIDAPETGETVGYDCLVNAEAGCRNGNTPVLDCGVPNAGNFCILGYGQLSSQPGGSSSTSEPGATIYIVRMFDQGQYNSSIEQPNSVTLLAGSQQSFNNNWNSYWNNVVKLQNSSVYVVNSINVDISQTPAIQALIQLGPQYVGFTPDNITSDSYGDVFISGDAQFLMSICSTCTQVVTVPVVVRVTNTITANDMFVTANTVESPGTGCSTACVTQNEHFPEIAVSPTGKIVYLASPTYHDIIVYDGQSLSYDGIFNLEYAAEIPGANEQPEINPSCNSNLWNIAGAGGQGVLTPVANLSTYFLYGGLDGINASLQSTPLEKQLYNLLWSSGAIDNSQSQGDVLDRDCFHYPLAIQDVNGYLYVLDNWRGTFGATCKLHIGNTCPQGGPIFENTEGGLNFNMYVLRVINSTGVDVPIDPTNFSDLWIGGGFLQTSRFSEPGITEFPPYGWILTANIINKGQNGPYGNRGSSVYSLQLCAGLNAGPGSLGQLNSVVNCTVPQSPSASSFQPLLPGIAAQFCPGNGALGTYTNGYLDCGTPASRGVRMAVSSNYTIAVYVPSVFVVQQVAPPSSSGGGALGNEHGGLAFFKLDVENYTRTIGKSGPPLQYTCYTTSQGDSSSAPGIPSGDVAGPCTFAPGILNGMWGPIYIADNPFEYTENIGSLRTLSAQAQFYSEFSIGGTQQSSSSQSAEAQSVSDAYTNNFSPQELDKILLSPSSIKASSQLPIPITTTNTVIKGYTIVPFSYQYQTIQYITQQSASSAGCPSITQTITSPYQTEFTYATSNLTQSNWLPANVEGGTTYAQYVANESLYQENRSAITLPPQILYNIITDRNFTSMYINATFGPYTNKQGVINASSLQQFETVVFSQGGNPGYAQLNTTKLSPPCTGQSCADPYIGAPPAYSNGFNNLTYVHTISPSLVTLFDWDRTLLYSSLTYLKLNVSKANNNEVYGYHRFVFTYIDRFNNKYFMPIDADVANQTNITLSITPVVNNTNTNQTIIYINGTASYTPIFSTVSTPLRGGDIYVYYDTDLDYANYDPLQPGGFHQNAGTVYAQLCAYSNVTSVNGQTINCTLSDPSFTALTQNARVITYTPQSNTIGALICNPPPKGILQQPVNDCNVYGKDNLPQTCPVSQSLEQQFCVPQLANGDGLCSSQVGLIGIAKTDSNGNFSINTTACGTGYHAIIAKYYGTPGGEPITAYQSSIGEAYDPGSGQYESFPAINFSWAPTTSAETIVIGSFLLSYGTISVIGIISVILIIIAIWAAKSGWSRAKRQGSQKRRRRQS